MTIKNLVPVFLLSASCAFLFSCQKTNNGSPTIDSPIVVLTPSAPSGYAGQQVAIDYSTTALHGIKRIQIYTQYLSNPKVTAKDSTLATTSADLDLNFIYTIPDTAVQGQQGVVTFVITDGNGNATTKAAIVSVTGSRPLISVSPTSPTANPGDSIVFNVVMSSPDKYIQTLDISQAIDSSSYTSIAGIPFPDNPLKVNYAFHYQVPATTKAGDVVHLVFTVANSNAITNGTSADIKVN